MVKGWFVNFDHGELLVTISWPLLSDGVERRFLGEYGEDDIFNVLVLVSISALK